jgi:hypothetical protein
MLFDSYEFTPFSYEPQLFSYEMVCLSYEVPWISEKTAEKKSSSVAYSVYVADTLRENAVKTRESQVLVLIPGSLQGAKKGGSSALKTSTCK